MCSPSPQVCPKVCSSSKCVVKCVPRPLKYALKCVPHPCKCVPPPLKYASIPVSLLTPQTRATSGNPCQQKIRLICQPLHLDLLDNSSLYFVVRKDHQPLLPWIAIRDFHISNKVFQACWAHSDRTCYS